jgi:polyisoprenoid-binding protein YceI
VTRRRLLLSLFLLLGGVAGAAGVWYFFFSGQAPAAASIDEAAHSIGSSAAPSTSAAPSASLDGTWQVDTTIGNFSDYSSTYAGFRVAEVLDNIGDSVAVGRTPDVSGELTLAGQTLTAARVEVQLTTIMSDRPRRDPAIQQALETSTYPTATFELTDPIDLPSAPAEGVTYNTTTPGTLTIHGVSKQIDIALEARLVNGVIVIVGSADVTFSDYGVTMPRAPIVLSVADDGQIEFQLFFTRSG